MHHHLSVVSSRKLRTGSNFSINGSHNTCLSLLSNNHSQIILFALMGQMSLEPIWKQSYCISMQPHPQGWKCRRSQWLHPLSWWYPAGHSAGDIQTHGSWAWKGKDFSSSLAGNDAGMEKGEDREQGELKKESKYFDSKTASFSKHHSIMD